LSARWQRAVHEHAIALAWDSSGAALVVGDAAGTVWGFEASSGRPRWRGLQVHEGGVLALAAHPTRPWVVSGGQDGRALLWDVERGAVEAELDGERRWVEHAAWSPNGDWVATSSGAHVSLWDPGGARVWRSERYAGAVIGLGWCGVRELAVACNGELSVWEAPSGALAQRFSWRGAPCALALPSTGPVLAVACQDNMVRFWRRETGKASFIAGYPHKPSALCFDPSGALLATCDGPDISVWSFEGEGPEGREPAFLALHEGAVSALAFGQWGRALASGGQDAGLVLWELGPTGHGEPVGAGVAMGPVERVAFSPDDRALAAVDAAGGVSVWDRAMRTSK
jgi:WD40 repeat protein